MTTGWINAGTGWASLAQAYGRLDDEDTIRQAAKKAAVEHVVIPMQEWILGDPTLNGRINRDWDFTSVIPFIGVWEQDTQEAERQMFVGVPTGEPKSDLAHNMEYGSVEDQTQAPTPVLRNTYESARQDAWEAFQAHLHQVAQHG